MERTKERGERRTAVASSAAVLSNFGGHKCAWKPNDGNRKESLPPPVYLSDATTQTDSDALPRQDNSSLVSMDVTPSRSPKNGGKGKVRQAGRWLDNGAIFRRPLPPHQKTF